MPNQEIIHLIQTITAMAYERGDTLTSIHILKYLYLADLYFARDNSGETFTKLPWTFHNFGPYCNRGIEAINEALKFGALQSKTISALKIENDFEVFSASHLDPTDFDRLGRRFTARAWGSLQRDIKRFGRATGPLLHYVYCETEPMENAQPFTALQFAVAEWPPVALETKRESADKKTLKAAREILSRITMPQALPNPTPVDTKYTKTYIEGVIWLNQMEQIEGQLSGIADVTNLLRKVKP